MYKYASIILKLFRHKADNKKGIMHRGRERTPNQVSHQELLNSWFEILPTSKLKEFIEAKTGTEKSHFTLAEILIIIKDVVSREKLSDPSNPAVIICSRELEEALDVKAIHVTQVRAQTLNQLVKIPEQMTRETTFKNIQDGQEIAEQDKFPRNPTATSNTRIIRSESTAPPVSLNHNMRVEVNPRLLNVVRQAPNTEQQRTIYTYGEITRMLSNYILARKEVLFDQRNIQIALVADDPLGKVFEVNAFHRAQLNALLWKQLRPARVFTDQVSERRQGRVVGNGTAGQGRTRQGQRNNSSSEQAANSETPVQARRQTNEQRGEDTSSGINSRDHIGEYEIESSEDEDRPPQAMGRGGEFSSPEDTDSDLREAPWDSKVTTIEHEGKNNKYSGDDEQEVGAAKDVRNQMTRPKAVDTTNKKCCGCRVLLPSAYPYCKKCWNIRKEWIPERPKRKRTTDSVKARKRAKLMSTERSVSESLVECTQVKSTTVMEIKQQLAKQGEPAAADLCTLCCQRDKNTLFVHGRIGHQLTCFPCAKRLWKKQAGCPACRRKISQIIKVIPV